MSLLRRTAVRRLLIGMLLMTALTGGLWWNSTRLNETEKRLVGVWEEVGPNHSGAAVLLSDRTALGFEYANGKWIASQDPALRWKASPGSLTIRLFASYPAGVSLHEWQEWAMLRWSGEDRNAIDIVRLTDTELECREPGTKTETLRRSTDPELLRLFERLNAGKSP